MPSQLEIPAAVDRVSAINGLRGLAILAVLWHHAGVQVGHIDPPALQTLLAAVLASGWSGVNLFFILSGFVLFLPYAEGKRRLTGWADASAFYRRRFLRLMPLYYFAAFVVLILRANDFAAAAHLQSAKELLTFSYVFQRYAFMPSANPPLWSLGVEVLFSIVFPVLVIGFVRFGALRVLVAALAAALLLRIAGRMWNLEVHGAHFVCDNIFGRIDEFVIGMAIARLHAAGRIPAWASWLWVPGILLILLAWTGFYAFGQVAHVPIVPLSLLNNILDAGYGAIMLAALREGSAAGRLLSLPALQVPGMMCYSLYIWHVPISEQVGTKYGTAAGLLMTVIVAAFTYRYIEFRNVANWRALFLLPSAKRASTA
ncbi:acyltransferase family protein [Limobrevibacterium gyesilva]|uniref:Acyltransferase n=1 Tax=Limobrevibacterium gyesilva TaxID=2991712 RepID=A0AA41YMJ4_9PROT|nr:acyltransferase [Limobrevibacterium gyesilva]MCW3473243.1 acyltransferase [Limobrevibacterium gyesilva]